MQKIVTMMQNLSVSRDSIRLLRIPFSLYLAPVYLLALSQASQIAPQGAILSFMVLHFLVYPASNGYNSYIDKDEGSIGGLEKPPPPSRQLFYLTLALDTTALLISVAFISLFFAFCLLLYIVASRAYSAPQIRLKKYALPGFLTVVLFQGAFACFMSLAGISGTVPIASASLLWLLLACSLQIAGVYPLTQVYQHSDDKRAGVETLSIRLGLRGTFHFTAIMFLLCSFCYGCSFYLAGRAQQFLLLQLFLLPVLIYFTRWYLQVRRDPGAANFRNTMRMNTIAAICTGACFTLFSILY